MARKLVDVDCTLIREREKAVLVESTQTGREAWVPKSVCEIERIKNSTTVVLTLSEDIAIEKELV